MREDLALESAQQNAHAKELKEKKASAEAAHDRATAEAVARAIACCGGEPEGEVDAEVLRYNEVSFLSSWYRGSCDVNSCVCLCIFCYYNFFEFAGSIPDRHYSEKFHFVRCVRNTEPSVAFPCFTR